MMRSYFNKLTLNYYNKIINQAFSELNDYMEAIKNVVSLVMPLIQPFIYYVFDRGQSHRVEN